MKLDTTTITKVIIWLGFCSFLSISIPHVAWLYQVYEPSNDFYAVVTSYGAAIGIDVMIAWLSFICASGKVLDWVVTVVFILALCFLSQYANFLYAMAHNPIYNPSDVWNISVLGGLSTTGYLTPLIISAIPFFSLAYTFMLSRLTGVKIDTAALEEQLKNKKDALDIRRKYQPESKDSLEDKAKGALTSIVGVVRHAVKEVSGKESTVTQEVVQSVVSEVITEESEGVPEEYSNVVQIGSTSTRNVPLEVAGQMLQYDITTVKRMISQGKLRTPNKSSQLVTMASVNAMLSKKQPASRKVVSEVLPDIERDTDEIAIPESDNDQRVAQIIEMCTQDLVNV